MPRNFWCLFQGQLVSHLGMQAFQVMALFYLASQTGSPSGGAAYLALGCLPPVVLGPWLAAWSTRFSPRSVLVTCDALSAACALPIACALLLAAPSALLVGLMLATVTLLSCVNAMLMPSIQATLPRIVPAGRLAGANSLMVTTQQLATTAGQGLGGLLYGLAGPAALSIATTVGFAASAVWGARMRGTEVTEPVSVTNMSKPVFSLLKTNPAFRTLAMSSAAFNVLFAPWIVLLPFHLAPHGLLAPQVFGFALAAYGVGNIVGALATKRLLASVGARLLGITMCAQGLGLIALGCAHGVFAIVSVLVVLGFGTGLASVLSLVRAQTCVPPDLVAPAAAVLRACARLAMPVGYAVVSLSKSWLDAEPSTVYMVCGTLMTVTLLPFIRALAAGSSTAVVSGGAAH